MHDWRLLEAFLYLPVTPDWESVGREFKYSAGIFNFLKKKPSLISLILNTKSKNTIVFLKTEELVALSKSSPFHKGQSGANTLHDKFSWPIPILSKKVLDVSTGLWT